MKDLIDFQLRLTQALGTAEILQKKEFIRQPVYQNINHTRTGNKPFFEVGLCFYSNEIHSFSKFLFQGNSSF